MNEVWVFNGNTNHFPSGVFSSENAAKAWIARHNLEGTLTAYPIDTGVYEWAIEKGYFRPKKEYHYSSEFIGNFSTASQYHEHFANDED